MNSTNDFEAVQSFTNIKEWPYRDQLKRFAKTKERLVPEYMCKLKKRSRNPLELITADKVVYLSAKRHAHLQK